MNKRRKDVKLYNWAGAWSSGYGRRLVFQKVVGSNHSTVYWMDIFHSYLL